MIEKTIIANYGDGDLGKSKSIILAFEKLRKVADKNENGEIKEEIVCPQDKLNGDICYILTINNVKVGISSQGDPRSAQKWLLEELDKRGCRIILTACRYYGATERERLRNIIRATASFGPAMQGSTNIKRTRASLPKECLTASTTNGQLKSPN